MYVPRDDFPPIADTTTTVALVYYTITHAAQLDGYAVSSRPPHWCAIETVRGVNNRV